MNDRQNTVVATVACGLILVVVFLCPWRVDQSNEIKISPIYQPPMSYVRSYDAELGSRGGSEIISNEAEIAYGIWALEVVALLIGGGLVYVLTSDPDQKDDSS